MSAVVTHLPGCNLKHEGGNFRWTCRYQLALPDPRPHGSSEHPPVELTVSADGPCTGSGTVDVSLEFTAYVADDLDLLASGILPWLQQALAEVRPLFLDWEQRSQCQHPETEDCPE